VIEACCNHLAIDGDARCAPRRTRLTRESWVNEVFAAPCETSRQVVGHCSASQCRRNSKADVNIGLRMCVSQILNERKEVGVCRCLASAVFTRQVTFPALTSASGRRDGTRIGGRLHLLFAARS